MKPCNTPRLYRRDVTVEMRYLRREDALVVGDARFPREKPNARFEAAVQEVGDASLSQSADRFRCSSVTDDSATSPQQMQIEFPRAELVVTPAPGYASWPSISFRVMA